VYIGKSEQSMMDFAGRCKAVKLEWLSRKDQQRGLRMN
jgi:hypothetical protein